MNHTDCINRQTTLGKPLDHIGVAQAVPAYQRTASAITSSGKAWWGCPVGQCTR